MDSDDTIANGAIVIYTGSVTPKWGAPMYVICRNPGTGRYDLGDHYAARPGVVLRNVRRRSIRPTGEIATLCWCCHDAASHDAWTCERGWCVKCG